MIFKAIKIVREARDSSEDPNRFVKKQIQGALFELIIGPVIVLLAFLGFLFMLAYTNVLGGPYGLARFFFWFIFFVYFITGAGVYMIYKTFKQAVRTTTQNIKKDASPRGVYRDAEVVEEGE